MANKIYGFDDYGIKHETMSKEQIENAISTGEIKKDVFEGSIEYNGETVSYNYAGSKPDDTIILKLLACGINPKDNALTPIEIQTYLGMDNFSFHFYYSETEIYATNAKNGYLGFEKVGIGTCKLYPNGEYQLGYFMKSSKKINDVLSMGEKEFEDTPKQEETIYIVDDAEYTQNVIVNCYYDGSNISLGDNELKKLINNSYDRLLLKMNYTNTEDTQYEFLKLKQYTNDSRYDTYEFENSQHYIEISITQETLDSINLFGQVVPKATTADNVTTKLFGMPKTNIFVTDDDGEVTNKVRESAYSDESSYAGSADYSIKNPSGTRSKFTHDSSGVLKVDDTDIVSKKRLLWSGEVNIEATLTDEAITIYTSDTDLTGKTLEIWLKDAQSANHYSIKSKIKEDSESSSTSLYDEEKISMSTNMFTGSYQIGTTTLKLSYDYSTFTIKGRHFHTWYNIKEFTTESYGVNHYVTEIYEIIE